MTSSSEHVHLLMAMASLRKQFAPAPDDPDAWPEQCEDCGETFYRRKGRRRHRCPDCAAARGVRAVDSMAHREGEVYERAVRKALAYWTGEAMRLGLLTAEPQDGATGT